MKIILVDDSGNILPMNLDEFLDSFIRKYYEAFDDPRFGTEPLSKEEERLCKENIQGMMKMMIAYEKEAENNATTLV